MPVNNPGTLQSVTENGATTNIKSTFKNATSDVEGLVVDVTDATGFAKAQVWKLSGADALYYGTIFGINGFVNILNNSFFFGNGNAANFYLINTTAGIHTISVNGNGYDFGAAALALNAKNILTTGTFTDGTTPIVSGHTHLGTGNTGAIIPHVNTQPARALDTVYTNSGSRPIIVHGSVECSVKAPGDVATVTLFTDANNPPTTAIQTVGIDWRAVAVLNEQIVEHFGFFMVVKQGEKYQITTNPVGSGALTLGFWNETDF